MSKRQQKVEEVEIPIPGEDTTNSQILDAVKTLTETVGDLVKNVDEMRKEYGLKKRAGVFDK